jgi:putative endonuclease
MRGRSASALRNTSPIQCASALAIFSADRSIIRPIYNSFSSLSHSFALYSRNGKSPFSGAPTLLDRLIFAVVEFRARRGLSTFLPGESPKDRARRTGLRGETYAYWFLRRRGYTVIARNFTLPNRDGEIDLVGYDRDTLAFVEVKTRDASSPNSSRPEDAVNSRKRVNLAQMAAAFLRAHRLDRASVSTRFDILAIETRPGSRPAVRLHKGAFTLPRA